MKFDVYSVVIRDGRSIRRVYQVIGQTAAEAVAVAMAHDETISMADHGASIGIQCSRVVGRRVESDRPRVL